MIQRKGDSHIKDPQKGTSSAKISNLVKRGESCQAGNDWGRDQGKSSQDEEEERASVSPDSGPLGLDGT